MLLQTPLSPDLAVLAGCCGAGLLCMEFNRPGRVLPAAAGLLLTLFATASLVQDGVRSWAAALLAAALLLCLAGLWRRLPQLLLPAGPLALVVSLRFLVVPAGALRVHWPTAVLCGGALGAALEVLVRIAHRARRAKALD